MATSSSSEPQKRAPLTLRIIPPRSRLLELPRELRDKIYEHALIDPPLWDRRHSPSCTFYDPNAAREIPPFAILGPDPNALVTKMTTNEAARVKDATWDTTYESCYDNCLARRGIWLLFANKQIHEEASQIFWRYNTFCFESMKDLLEDLEHETAVSRVRSISLMTWQWDFVYRHARRDEASADLGLARDKLMPVLMKMPNLRNLELPLGYFSSLVFDLLKLPTIKSIRTVQVCDHKISPYYPYDEYFDHRMRTFQAVNDAVREDMFAPSDILLGCSRVGRWFHTAQKRLRQEQAATRSHAPFTFPVEYSDRNGSRQGVVKVWGLPVNKYCDRRDVARDSRVAAAFAHARSRYERRAALRRLWADYEEDTVVDRSRRNRRTDRKESKVVEVEDDAKRDEGEATVKKREKKRAARDRKKARKKDEMEGRREKELVKRLGALLI